MRDCDRAHIPEIDKAHIADDEAVHIVENEAGRMAFAGGKDNGTPGLPAAGNSGYKPPVYKVYMRKGNMRNKNVVSRLPVSK